MIRPATAITETTTVTTTATLRPVRVRRTRGERARLWIQKRKAVLFIRWLWFRHRLGIHYIVRSRVGVLRRCLICGRTFKRGER